MQCHGGIADFFGNFEGSFEGGVCSSYERSEEIQDQACCGMLADNGFVDMADSF